MADIHIEVKLGLSTPIDITGRTISLRGRYGRQRASASYSAGYAAVMVGTDDNFLAPGRDDATVTADDIIGVRLTIAAATEPIAAGVRRWTLFDGEVSRVTWKQDELTATAQITAVDDFAILAAQEIDLASVPAETTDERLARILDAASYPTARRDLRSGTVACIPTNSLSGNALTLARQVADTEGGRLAVAHGGEATGTPAASKFTLLPRGTNPPVAVTVSDSPVVGQASFAARPQALSDDRLLVTATSFTDGAGTVHEAQTAAAVAKYGKRQIARTTQSAASDTTAVADWWRSVFSSPLPRIDAVAVAPHLETAEVAAALLAGTVGTTVGITLRTPGAAAAQTAEYSVDGAQFTARPLDMAQSTAELHIRWALFPPEAALYWLLGDNDDGILGETTRLGPTPGLGGCPACPIPIREWATGETMSAVNVNGILYAQRPFAHATAADRDGFETNPHAGMLIAMGDDLTLRVWSGTAWEQLAIAEP